MIFINHIFDRLSFYNSTQNTCRLLVIGEPIVVASENHDFKIVHLSKADLKKYSNESGFSQSQQVTGLFEAIYINNIEVSEEIILALYRKVIRSGFLFLSNEFNLPLLKQAIKTNISKNIQVLKLYGGIEVLRGEWLESRLIDRYDYIPTSLLDPQLINKFSHLTVENPLPVKWPYLRKNSPHLWRVDNRCKGRIVGVLSTEEGAILYNLALLFKGKRVLEVGCHFGFSTAHLAKADVVLDVIDPRLEDLFQRSCVIEAIELTGINRRYFLWPGLSPDLIMPIYKKNNELWSMAFIDGNHDGDAPSNDALEVMKYMAKDAVIVFHDLHSPFVYAGLEQCRTSGWNISIQNTMQGLGIAYRGNIRLPTIHEDISMPAYKIPQPKVVE